MEKWQKSFHQMCTDFGYPKLIFYVCSSMRRTWCYKRLVLAFACATLIFFFLKNSQLPRQPSLTPKAADNSVLASVDKEQSNQENTLYQDTNSLAKNLKKHTKFRQKSNAYENITRNCYSTANTTKVLFINMNTKWTDLDVCAVKSAALFNPKTPICVLHAGSENLEHLRSRMGPKSGMPNVEVAPLDVLEIFEDTPLLAWYKQTVGEASERRYFHTELLDALRSAYLYKYGGRYLDTDAWTLKPLDDLPLDAIAKEASHLGYVSNFVMMFSRGHPFLKDVLREFPRLLNASRWGSGGTLLFTKLYEKRWRKRLNVMNAETFYPVHLTHGPILYEKASYDKVVEMTKNAHTVHLWREVYRAYWTGRSKPQQGSFVYTIYEQFCG